MRILRVITRLDVHGGAELSTLVELEELAAGGHDTMVATVSAPATPPAVLRLDAAGVTHCHLSGRSPRQAVELAGLVRSWRPDVVHAVIFRAELVTALGTLGRSTPTVVSLVNMQYAPEAVASATSPRRLEVIRRVESFALRHGIDRFHCLTSAGARHSAERLGIEPDRITVVPRGRRAEDLAVAADEVRRVRAELDAGDSPLLVNVGRHETQKGQDLLLDAVARLREGGHDLQLAIVGREGNLTPALVDGIATRGLGANVSMLGERDDVPALLAAADVVCVTSRWEGLGGSIIEALGVGAPIVGFGVDAVEEVVGDAGVLVDPFDIDGFAASVAEVVGDPARQRRMSVAAAERFTTEFEIGPVIDRVERLYADATR